MQFTQSQRFKSSLLLLAASGSPDTTQDDAAGGVITGGTQVEYNEEAAAHRNSSCYQPQGQLYSLLPLQPADASHHRNILSHPPTNNSHSFKSSASWNGAAHNYYSHHTSPAKTAGSGWRQGHGAANSSSIPTGDANQYARSAEDSPVPTCVGEQPHPDHHRMPILVTISPQPSRGIQEIQVQTTGTSFAPVAALQPARCASQIVAAPVVDASGILAALTALLSTQLTGSQLGNMSTQLSQQSLNIPSVLCQPSAAPHTSTVPAALPVPPTKPKKPKAKQSRGQQAEPALPLEKPPDTKAAKSHVTTGKGKVGFAPSWLNASVMQGSEMISEPHIVPSKDEEQCRFASATEINTFLKAYEERNKLMAGDPSKADAKRLALLSHLLIPSRPLPEGEVSPATALWIHQLLASASSIERISATPSNGVVAIDQKETLIGHLNAVERLVCSLHVEMERRRGATELSYEQDHNTPLAPKRFSCLTSGYFAFLISCEYAATQVLAALAPFIFIDPTSKDKQLSHVSSQVVAKALLVASMLLCDCVLAAKKGSSLHAPNAASSSPFALAAAAMTLTIKAAILRTHAENLDETKDLIGSSEVHSIMSLFLVSAAGVLLSSRDLYTEGSRPTASPPPQLPEPVPPSPFQKLNAKLPIRRAQRWAAIASESISGARRCFESLDADPPPPQSECTRGPRCHESMLSHTEVKSQVPTSSTSTSSSLAAHCAPVILPLLSECRRQHLQLRQKATPAEDLHSCPSLLSPKVCARHMTAFLIEDTLNAMCGVFD